MLKYSRIFLFWLAVAAWALPVEADVLTRFKEAVSAQSAGDFDRALTLYNSVLQSGELDHKSLSRGTYNRGIIFLRQKNYEMAIADFDTAIWLRPRYADAFNNRGLAHSRTGHFEKAIEDFTQALELKPQNPSALNNRGNVYRDMENYERAVADYDAAIALKKDYAFAYFNRGLAYEEQARAGDNTPPAEKDLWRLARESYGQALALLPGHPVIKERLDAVPQD